MVAYFIRRIAYALPILIGVNLLTFGLFFLVYTPDDMARTILGEKRVTPAEIETWKREHGYDLPRIFNTDVRGVGMITETIFWRKSIPLLLLRFGRSDHDNSSIGTEILTRLGPTLSISMPIVP